MVAQVFSYAGYLQRLDTVQLETQVLAAHLPPGGSVLAEVQSGDQQQLIDPVAFREELARSLAEGSVRSA